MPFTFDKRDGRVNIFNLDCLLPDAREHFFVPLSALEQNDQSGFLIDKLNEEHLTKILIPEVEISGGVLI